jgi:hypothetical protein
MSIPPSSLPPANWYPDPQTPGQLRYWDGQRWTQHVHPVQQPAQGVGGFAPTGGAAQAGGGYAPTGGTAQAGGGYAPTGGAAQAGGGYAPTGGAAQAGGGYAPTGGAAQAGGGYAPTGGSSPASGAMPTLEGALSSAGGTPYQPAQAATPQAAGPATAGTFLPAGMASHAAVPGGASASAVPPSGSLATFQPGVSAGTAGGLQVPKPRDLDDNDDGETGPAQPTQALFAFVFGTAALAATALGLYHPGTGLDDYFPYLGAGLGFLSVLFGLIGRRQTSGGFLRGTTESWFGIGAGFLAIALSAYEHMYPSEILERFKDLLGG